MMTQQIEFDSRKFSGQAPLFPLPNVVLFPHVAIPLLIFEQRYRAMLRHAMEHERVIGMALLQPGWEERDSPGIWPMACLGLVVNEERLPDGRSKILLLGVARAVVRDELQNDPFRIAEVDLAPEHDDAQLTGDLDALRADLIERVEHMTAHSPQLQKQLGMLLRMPLTLGKFADVLTSFLPLAMLEKQFVLQETDAILRAHKLCQLLDRLVQRTQLETLFEHEKELPSMN